MIRVHPSREPNITIEESERGLNRIYPLNEGYNQSESIHNQSEED
jgi:hypothetical protein